MKSFCLTLMGLNQHLVLAEVVSLIGEDNSGQFGVLASHEPMLACLQPGIVRITAQDKKRLYLAQPGAILQVEPSGVQLVTSRYLISEYIDKLMPMLDELWQTEQQRRTQDKQNQWQLEQALARKLWQLSQQGYQG